MESLSRRQRKHSERFLSPNPILLDRKAHPKSDFIGSEVRVRDDHIPTTHITVAVEGVRRSSPDYYPVASETGHSLRIAPVLASLGHHHETQVTQPRQLVHVLLDILL
jgi:hypothetical protein